MADTYTAHLVCTNCDYKVKVEIDKGRTVNELLLSFVCTNCGCKTLSKDPNPGQEVTYWDLIV